MSFFPIMVKEENIIIAIILNAILILIVLLSVGRLEKILGVGGIAVMRKVFGIVLLAMAVKLFSTNITHLLH